MWERTRKERKSLVRNHTKETNAKSLHPGKMRNSVIDAICRNTKYGHSSLSMQLEFSQSGEFRSTPQQTNHDAMSNHFRPTNQNWSLFGDIASQSDTDTIKPANQDMPGQDASLESTNNLKVLWSTERGVVKFFQECILEWHHSSFCPCFDDDDMQAFSFKRRRVALWIDCIYFHGASSRPMKEIWCRDTHIHSFVK